MTRRPRVIRRVVRWTNGNGRPKVARDHKAKIEMERIKARCPHWCDYSKCPVPERLIDIRTEYALVTWTNKPRMFVGRNAVPLQKKFHFDCVPPEARPLVRFFK